MSNWQRCWVTLYKGGHTVWSDQAACELLEWWGYGAPVDGDIVTLYHTTKGRGTSDWCETRMYMNGAWVTLAPHTI